MTFRTRQGAAIVCTIGAVTCILLGVMGQLGRWYEQFDLINVFAPYWSIIGLASGVVWITCRKWSLAALGTTVLILAIAVDLMGPELAARMSQTQSPPGSVKFVEYNAFDHNPSPGAAAAWIIGTGADIVIAEEVSGSARALLGDLAPTYPFEQSCLPQMRCSTIIFSRIRPSSMGSLAHADPENRKAPSAAWMRFGSGPKAFTVVGVHYQRPWPYGNQQMTRSVVLAMLARDGRARTIVAGDFNMTPWTFAMKRQDTAFAMQRLTRARFTWPSTPLPLLPIDQVYVGHEWRLASLALGPANGSDHHPVFFTLRDVGSL